jgi:hypothetical protein
MPTEDEMTLNERRKYLKRMKLRYEAASEGCFWQTQEPGRCEVGLVHRSGKTQQESSCIPCKYSM